MIAQWPSGMRQKPNTSAFSGGPADARASFKPDYGPPIERRRTTGVPEVYSAAFRGLTDDQIAAWRTFFEDDLKHGSLPFAWKDPARGDVVRWRVAPGDRPYEVAANEGYTDLSVSFMRLPGTPWWQPYVLSPQRVPYAVADYEEDVYGVDSESTAASAVADVAGTYDVYTYPDDGSDPTIELNHTVTAGDIPATQPVGVARIVAYEVA